MRETAAGQCWNMLLSQVCPQKGSREKAFVYFRGRDLEKSLGCFSSRKPIKESSSLENLHLLLPPRLQDSLWRPASGLDVLWGLLFICFAFD